MTSMEQEKRFDILAIALKRAGYKVKIGFSIGRAKYRYAMVKGHAVLGLFCPSDYHYTYPYCNGRICADHSKCYDKPSKCPLVMRLPKDEAEAKTIISQLRKLGTKQGFEVSNSYDYLRDNPFPYQMD